MQIRLEQAVGIERARAQLALTLTELSELAAGLHPPELAKNGLRPALASLAARIPLPVEVVGARRASGRPVIRLDQGVERGTTLEVDRAELPPTDDDEYYTFQLVGLEVVEENGRVLGTVADVLPGVANDVLSLDGGALLPMVEDCVRSIDLDAARIVVAEGFAD